MVDVQIEDEHSCLEIVRKIYVKNSIPTCHHDKNSLLSNKGKSAGHVKPVKRFTAQELLKPKRLILKRTPSQISGIIDETI